MKKSVTGLDNMSVSEDDAAALVDDKAGGVASSSGLGVEGTASVGAEDNDGRDDLVESSPPVFGGGRVLAERWRIDLHAEFVVDLDRLRFGTKAVQGIPHFFVRERERERERERDEF